MFSTNSRKSEDEKETPTESTAIIAKQLLARPNFISKTAPTEREFAELKRAYDLFGDKEFNPKQNFPSEITQTPWSPEYTAVNAIKVEPKKTEKDKEALQPKTHHISFFYYEFYRYVPDKNLYVFMCFANVWSPEAKMVCAVTRKSEQADGYLFVNSIKSIGNYRAGSVLIQCAVEFSLQMELAGKVKLKSINNTGQFYYKLGFAAKDPVITQQLQKGVDCCGDEMYLPTASIEAWKKRIAENTLLKKALLPIATNQFQSQQAPTLGK